MFHLYGLPNIMSCLFPFLATIIAAMYFVLGTQGVSWYSYCYFFGMEVFGGELKHTSTALTHIKYFFETDIQKLRLCCLNTLVKICKICFFSFCFVLFCL